MAGISDPILIAGATASGKSALALRLAERDGGVIVNADALQVYDCWRVLSARPGTAETSRIPHALYGHVGAAQRYSVGDWLRDVAPLLDALRVEGRRAIFVGGTGLYLDALIRGLARIPPVPPELRERSEARLAAGDLAGLIAELDPPTRAAIDLRNPRRVQRAWEVLLGTGHGLAHWQADPADPILRGFRGYVLHVNTDHLNNNITYRLETMVEDGALDECTAYAAQFRDPTLPSSRVLGAAEFLSHLRGERTLPEAIAAAAIATRQYAKRQRTWFRNRFSDWPRISSEDPLPE